MVTHDKVEDVPHKGNHTRHRIVVHALLQARVTVLLTSYDKYYVMDLLPYALDTY